MPKSTKSLENNLTKQETIQLFAQQLDAHTSVMIRTFPEAGLIIIPVQATVGTKAPEPFAMHIVSQMSFNKLPAVDGMLQSPAITEISEQVIVSDYGFGLHPPMVVAVDVSGSEILFVYHSSVGGKSFGCSRSYLLYNRFYLRNESGVSQYPGGFMQQP